MRVAWPRSPACPCTVMGLHDPGWLSCHHHQQTLFVVWHGGIACVSCHTKTAKPGSLGPGCRWLYENNRLLCCSHRAMTGTALRRCSSTASCTTRRGVLVSQCCLHCCSVVSFCTMPGWLALLAYAAGCKCVAYHMYIVKVQLWSLGSAQWCATPQCVRTPWMCCKRLSQHLEARTVVAPRVTQVCFSCSRIASIPGASWAASCKSLVQC